MGIRSLSLPHKLFVIPVAALVSTTLAAGLFTSSKFQRSVASAERAQLRSLSHMFSTIVTNRMAAATAEMKLTVTQEKAYDGFLAAQSGDPGPLRTFLAQTRALTGADKIFALQKDGRSLAGAAPDDPNGPTDLQEWLRPNLERGTLSGRQTRLDPVVFTKLRQKGDTADMITVGPILDPENNIVGVLTFVKRLDTQFLAEQKASFDEQVELSLATGDRLLAATRPGWKLPQALGGQEKYFEDRVEGRLVRHRFVPVGGLYLGLSHDASTSDRSRRSVRLLMVAAFGVSLSLVSLLILLSVRSVTVRLRGVVTTFQGIGGRAGDLAQASQVETRDEIGNLAEGLNRFVSRIRETVSRSRTLSRELAVASEKVRRSSREVTAGAGRQSEALGESCAAVGGIKDAMGGVSESTASLVEASEASSAAIFELGAATDEIATQMERLFSNVDDVSSAITEMSVVSKQVMGSVESLAASAETTASSIAQLDANISGIRESAEMTSQLSADVARDAQRGKEAVESSVQGVAALSEMMDQYHRVILDLGGRAVAIGRILTVIDEVADQTSLLALNAAIIAAQAGEHGKGFAVVADEIRELAERTAASTQEISSIIEHLQDGTQNAVKTMTAGRQQVQQEVHRAVEAGEALEKIRSSAFLSLDRVREIARATQEQSAGSREITAAIEQIARSLSEIASSTKQQSEGHQHLARAAESMREIASDVKHSTHEQAQGSLQITQNMERIRTMIGRIDEAARAQTGRTTEVLGMVSEVRSIADGNARRTAELDQAVESLIRHTSALEEEIGAFLV